MGIWSSQEYFSKKVDVKYRLSLDEGNTACSNFKGLAQFLKLKYVYLKREDLNPTGSFKDRSLAYQISYHMQSGKKDFVISSTGNAAISSIRYCIEGNCKLHVFVSPKIADDKLIRLFEAGNVKEIDINAIREGKIKKIEDQKFIIYFEDKPKAEAIRLSKEMDYIFLRGSTDDLAIVGYKTIAHELSKQVRDMDSLFIPCSSGASTIGIYSGFYDVSMVPPRIHIVQTTKVHPMASEYDKDFEKSDSSLATAISDKVALRKDQINGIVSKSGGFGWVISDKEINEAKDDLKKYCSLEVSFDSALSLAGLKKALKKGHKINKPVLLISGK